jgi:UDP-glucose 4-epimerase
MKILVTGGAGFIGSNLVDELVKQKHQVIVLDNLSTGQKKNLNKCFGKIRFINIDISSEKNTLKLEKELKGVDIVFHLAGLADIVPSIENPNSYLKVNVTGTLNILNAAKKNNIKKFIYAASASCYGANPKYPTDEKNIIKTEYPYALSKNLGEQLVLHWEKVYKLNVTSFRFFNVYGPRSRTTGAYGAVFGVFLAQKINEKPLTIVGDGRQTRDFIHVYDVVRALVLSIKKGKSGHVYNLGSGVETSVNLIAKIIGGKKIFVPKRPGEPQRSIANIKKIKNHLKWKPKISIKYGISMLMKNLDDWTNAPLWTPKKIKKATKLWFKYLK